MPGRLIDAFGNLYHSPENEREARRLAAESLITSVDDAPGKRTRLSQWRTWSASALGQYGRALGKEAAEHGGHGQSIRSLGKKDVRRGAPWSIRRHSGYDDRMLMGSLRQYLQEQA